ncbi:MAG: amidohydrolase, partial [Gemmatimonadetes bacterium]|nr:amidohydrolase [Gemmatimonadota bacterium]
MKITLRTALVLLAAAVVPLPAAAQAAGLVSSEGMKGAPPRAEGEGPWARLIVRGANLIDGTGGPTRGPVDIVIENNRIVRIVDVGFPNVPIDPKGRPTGATREIDVTGMY